mmetsp:Transcript_75268/g.178838  ORF Transcript_75268/g.178838 Transcript_75268/m.178838 type:complete len:306 (-) Transcript_75268:41-958(-)
MHAHRRQLQEDHMVRTGVAAPPAAPYNSGRRYQDSAPQPPFGNEDTGAVGPDVEIKGRRHMLPVDHFKTELWEPQQGSQARALQQNSDIKVAIEEAAVYQYGLVVSNPQLWAKAAVRRCGNAWVLEAITGDGKTVAREGASARAIANTLSMLAIADLRHFGLRFAGKGERPTSRQGEANNRSLDSCAVNSALNEGPPPPGRDPAQYSARHPYELSRKSAVVDPDHFTGACAGSGDGPGTHGHAKDDDFHEDGLEYGIGHGRRHIGTRDNLYAGVQISGSAKEAPPQGRRFVRPQDCGVVVSDWHR